MRVRLKLIVLLECFLGLSYLFSKNSNAVLPEFEKMVPVRQRKTGLSPNLGIFCFSRKVENPVSW